MNLPHGVEVALGYIMLALWPLMVMWALFGPKPGSASSRPRPVQRADTREAATTVSTSSNASGRQR